tara:strand:+ start:152 stop:910 length:759 start_codon:yes stop_codon:yes gene_type:complete
MTQTKTQPTYQDLTKLMFTSGNPKTDKNLKIESLKKYWIKRLNLAPASISGFNTCASSSIGCRKACLHASGNPVFMSQKTLGRVNRTLLYFKDRAKFLSMITKEIRNHEKNCKKHNLKPVIRLNTTSDIMFENHKIMELFPNVQFYDYTKHFKRMIKFLRGELPSNYHLTFSKNEANDKEAIEVLKRGGNVAIVFRKELPEYFHSYKVISGDDHDLRFLDDKNVVVGLKEKPALNPETGKKEIDQSGFVIDL